MRVEDLNWLTIQQGDIFKYNKSIDKNTDFVLDGVYAYRDINRVGIDTNRGIITLAPGKMNLRLKETSVILKLHLSFLLFIGR